jgi:hypothetical protein
VHGLLQVVPVVACLGLACSEPARVPQPAAGPSPATAPGDPVPPRVDRDTGEGEAPEQGMLRLINAYRRAAGVDPVSIDPELTEGCREHARYMVLNRGKPQLYSINAHHQDPELPGATPAGAECGKHADLYPNVPDLRAAVHGWMATLYHRRPILSPRITRVGIGSAPLPAGERVAVALRFVYGDAADAPARPIAYPADGQTDVPVDFQSEAPTPIPPGGSATPGYPFTLQVPASDPLSDVDATLEDGDGNAVPIYLSSPEKPASKYNRQRGLIGVIPQQTLRAGERYTATVTATWKGEPGTWTSRFTTMARTEVEATDEAALLAAVGKPARVRGVVKRASKITSGTVMLKLEGPPAGGSILSVAATVPLDQVSAETELTSKSRYLNELRGLTVEVDATPSFDYRSLRLEVPPTGRFRVVR